jgi:hypothetical protein
VPSGTRVNLAAAGAEPEVWISTAPHWFGSGKLVEGSATVKTKGALKFYSLSGTTITCKVKDTETISNPASGLAGTDSITAFSMSKCKAASSVESHYCSKNEYEVLPNRLPWASHLAVERSLPGIRDVIEGDEMEVRCPKGGRFLQNFKLALRPRVGKSVLELERSEEATGSDSLKGSGKNKVITAA